MPRKNENARLNRTGARQKAYRSTLQDHRKRSCSGKRCYVSMREAMETIEYLGKSTDLVAYDCDFCKGIHIGHQR